MVVTVEVMEVQEGVPSCKEKRKWPPVVRWRVFSSRVVMVVIVMMMAVRLCWDKGLFPPWMSVHVKFCGGKTVSVEGVSMYCSNHVP